MLVRALKSTADTKALSNNFVYQHPTTASLATYVTTFASCANSSRGAESRDHTIAAMNALVAKYTQNLPAHAGSLERHTEAGCILLTGTTGVLGTALLVEFAASAEVEKIYAVNRRGSTPAKERQRTALQAQNADLNVLDCSKIVWIETNLEDANLGLRPEVYQEVSSPL